MLKVLVQWPTLICRLRIKQFIEPWILVSLFSFLFKEKEKCDIEGYVGDPLGAGSVIPSKEGYQE
jgi:hypothetical protein